jgi:hypothetical protein
LIDFGSSRLETIGVEYRETVSAFRTYVLWATDRLRLVHSERADVGWGVIILVIAAEQKMYLLKNIARDRALEVGDGAIEEQRTILERDWLQYLHDFRAAVDAEVVEQFESSVLTVLSTAARHRSVFEELQDLWVFCKERDTVELFLRGSKLIFPTYNFGQRVAGFDETVRSHVLTVVAPKLRAEYSVERLEVELSRRWLPPEFWWRHINWDVAPRRRL